MCCTLVDERLAPRRLASLFACVACPVERTRPLGPNLESSAMQARALRHKNGQSSHATCRRGDVTSPYSRYRPRYTCHENLRVARSDFAHVNNLARGKHMTPLGQSNATKSLYPILGHFHSHTLKTVLCETARPSPWRCAVLCRLRAHVARLEAARAARTVRTPLPYRFHWCCGQRRARHHCERGCNAVNITHTLALRRRAR